MIHTFSGCTLDTDRHLLKRDGREIAVEPQVFDVLRLLAENAGSIVTKDQLIDVVWAGRIVSEASISSRINAARTAVGDNGKDQAVIRTIPRRGFMMVADVNSSPETASVTAPKPRQIVRYTKSTDGRSIAWASAGDGEPVLFAWHHLSHLEKDWASGLLGPCFKTLTEGHRMIRYDVRGSGLSDPINETDTFDRHVDDMIAVADAAGLETFPVVAMLQNAAVAIRVAAKYPDRVSRMVLTNAYARGRAIRENAAEVPEHDPFIALLSSGGWGDPNDAFMRAWATMVLPAATSEETTELIELIAHAGSTKDALLQRELIDHLDVTGDLENVRCPTLVIHSRLCAIHPVGEGRRVAAGIEGAQFLEIDSANTFFISSDPAIDQQLGATLEFLGEG